MSALHNFIKDYGKGKLFEGELKKDPFEQFDAWFKDAINEGIREPNVIILATASGSGRPSARTVLLKDYSRKGFAFFTNYNSRKGRQIGRNPFGSLLFPWHSMERQVRIEGKIEKVSGAESDRYFNSRPEGSRIAAWASPQSEEIPSREYLIALENKYKQQFKKKSVPRPPNWGGYRLVPDLFEFWQGRENRLHDRFEYRLKENNWIIIRLAP